MHARHTRIDPVRITILFLISFALATVLCAPSDEKAFLLPPEIASVTQAPGAELIQANCMLCHSLDYITTQPRLTRAQWKSTIQKMQQKYGAPLQEEPASRVLNYLVANYGNENPPDAR